MSIDYVLAGWFPFERPADDALAIVAELAGPPVDQRIQQAGLMVYPVPPEADELPMMRRYLGFEPNLSLIFAPYGDDDQLAEAQRTMLRSAALLARRGVRGLLFDDYGPAESLILKLENGRLTLNESWLGWQGPPHLMSAVPEPYETQHLTFANA
jgi:hypothetical protein